MNIGNIKCYGVIYKITNKTNGKVYIGQTIKDRGFNGRYDYSGVGIERVYKVLLINKKSKSKFCNTHLLTSIEKYGLDSFDVCEVFDVAFSKYELDIKERTWISIYKSTNRNYGYNFTHGGSNGKPVADVNRRNSLSKIGKNLRSENPNSKKVICLTTNEIFNCTIDAAERYKLNRTAISQACSGKRKLAGSLENGEKLVWMYYDEYINNKLEVENRLNPEYIKPKSTCKKVVCLTTGIVFNSISEAALYYNQKSNANISSCCKGKLDYSGKLPDGTKLVWEYLEE